MQAQNVARVAHNVAHVAHNVARVAGSPVIHLSSCEETPVASTWNSSGHVPVTMETNRCVNM